MDENKNPHPNHTFVILCIEMQIAVYSHYSFPSAGQEDLIQYFNNILTRRGPNMIFWIFWLFQMNIFWILHNRVECIFRDTWIILDVFLNIKWISPHATLAWKGRVNTTKSDVLANSLDCGRKLIQKVENNYMRIYSEYILNDILFKRGDSASPKSGNNNISQCLIISSVTKNPFVKINIFQYFYFSNPSPKFGSCQSDHLQ